jgi:hypothetical protein
MIIQKLFEMMLNIVPTDPLEEGGEPVARMNVPILKEMCTQCYTNVVIGLSP